MLMMSGNILMAQADTVLVPNILDGDPFGAINKFINGDTTATGERANIDRYYKLEKNKLYLLNGEFHANYTLRLIADDVADGEKPPIVASTAGADGVIQLIQFKLFGDGYIKNIIFQLTPPSGNGESSASFFLSKEGGNYVFDNVRWEWGLWTAVVTEKPVNKITVKNCYFRNPEHRTNIWNGRGVGFYQENPADTVIMQNNTFFNMNAFAFFADISSIPPKYFVFDHNTVCNTIKFPIHSFWLPNATVTNNIFYNGHSYGENAEDVVGQDPEGLLYGIINIEAIPSDLIGYYGIDESERRYIVGQNVFFYEQDIKDYWEGFNLPENPFMNERVTGMFADDATYPYLYAGSIFDENPNFIEAGEGMSNMITWMSNRRNKMGNTYWGWDPDNNKFAVQWPFPEDLSYTNEHLQTAADGGFPLGDLNWWGSKKQEWESWIISGVNQVSNFTELNITPNPTTDQININYKSKSSSPISISLYNINGAKITNIFVGKQTIGSNTVSYNLTNHNLSNGTYIVQLQSGNDVVTKKFVVVK